jgi:hypothetical protein
MTYEQRLVARLEKRSPNLEWSFEYVEVRDTKQLAVVATHPTTKETAGLLLGETPKQLDRKIMLDTILAVGNKLFTDEELEQLSIKTAKG